MSKFYHQKEKVIPPRVIRNGSRICSVCLRSDLFCLCHLTEREKANQLAFEATQGKRKRTKKKMERDERKERHAESH